MSGPRMEGNRMSKFSRANSSVQWFEDNYPGAVMDPNVVILHTTETTGWPSYGGGATAPNYTAHPVIRAKRLDWRQHYPDERSARALQNHAGGVETNTLNCVQVELVGTCDPQHRHRWGSLIAGRDYIYWPDAPEWALDDVADFIADQHKRHGTRLEAPKFVAYPGSYGTTPTRLTGKEWRNFYGVCGHQHVPENVHGDPGDINIDRILTLAKAKVGGGGAQSVVPAKAKRPTRVSRFRDGLRAPRVLDVKLLDAAVQGGRRGTVKTVRDNIDAAVKSLPYGRRGKGKTRVQNFIDKYRADRVVDLNILDRSVADGRKGKVKDVRDRIEHEARRLTR